MLLIQFGIFLSLPGIGFSQTANSEYQRGLDPMGENARFLPIAILIGIASFLVILTRPAAGLAIIMVFYPFLGSTSGISVMELVSAAMIAAFIIAWVVAKIILQSKEKDFLSCEKLFLAFNIYLGFNSLMAVLSGIPVIDVIRDLVPLANLFMFLVVKTFVRKKKTLAFLLRIQFGVVIVLAVKGLFIQITGLVFLDRLLPAGITSLQIITMLIMGVGGLIFFRKNKKLFGFCALVSGLTLILTTNRTSFLASIGCILLMIFLSRRSRKVIALSLIAGVIFVTGFFIAMNVKSQILEEKKQRLTGIVGGHQLSLLNRLDEISQCAGLFRKHPVFGVGIGYRYVFFRHFVSGVGEGVMENNYTHSDLMNFLAKLGLVGTLLFFWFYIRICRLCWKVWKKAPTEAQQAKGMMCFIVLVSALLIGQSTPIIQSKNASLFLGMVLGYAFCLYREAFEKVLR